MLTMILSKCQPLAYLGDEFYAYRPWLRYGLTVIRPSVTFRV